MDEVTRKELLILEKRVSSALFAVFQIIQEIDTALEDYYIEIDRYNADQ